MRSSFCLCNSSKRDIVAPGCVYMCFHIVYRMGYIPLSVFIACLCCVCVAVELRNAQILSKSGGESEEKWKPWTSRYMYQVGSRKVNCLRWDLNP